MMNIDKKKQISLESPYFDAMRTDLDRYIRSALSAMEAKGIDSGSVALKIDFATIKETIKCENSPTGERVAVTPHIGYKLTLAMQAKSERKGDVVGKGNEIIRDRSGAYYIVSKDEASGQLNMFNCYDEFDQSEKPIADHLSANDDDLPDVGAMIPDEAYEEDSK